MLGKACEARSKTFRYPFLSNLQKQVRPQAGVELNRSGMELRISDQTLGLKTLFVVQPED